MCVCVFVNEPKHTPKLSVQHDSRNRGSKGSQGPLLYIVFLFIYTFVVIFLKWC